MTRARLAVLAYALAAAPAASASSGLNYLDGVLGKIADVIVNPLIRLLFAASLVLFAWGIVKFVRGAGDESERSIGRRHMLWGIVGMAIMVSVFAVIQIALGPLGVQPDFSF
jgi:hypothetical protein